MSKNAVEKPLIRHARDTLLATVGSLALFAPSIAGMPAAAVPVAQPAQQCLKDVGSFNASMRKDGYWIDDAGLGYPMYGYGYGYGFGFGGRTECEVLCLDDGQANPARGERFAPGE